MALPFSDLTRNVATDDDYVVTGDGILDDLMETFTAHLKAQWCDGKITGVEYATVYLGAMQSVMQTAAKIFLERELTEKQIDLVNQQIAESVAKTALLTSQKATEDAKVALVTAQTLGFKVDGKQKLFAKSMESWAVFESVNKTNIPVNPVENTNLTAMYNEINVLLGGQIIT